MSILVVGSVAIDTVETPFGAVESVLGGSAVYFALAASLFCPVRLVSVVGEDFPESYCEMLRRHSIGLEGLSVTAGKTFRWEGLYDGAMNEARTRRVQLNVFGDFHPDVPECCRDCRFVFLANCSPHAQLDVRSQLPRADFVLADTMNLWIRTERQALLELLAKVDGLILNDAEARQLSGCDNLLKAAAWIRQRGPAYCIIKKAEHGAILVGPGGVFALPGYPTEEVRDPTGAGDSFAGGLMGYAATCDRVTDEALRVALAYGTVLASFTIEDFGTARLSQIGRADVERRLEEFVRRTHLSGKWPC